MHYPLGIIIESDVGLEKEDAIWSAKDILDDHHNIGYDYYKDDPESVKFYNASQNDFWETLTLLITKQKEEVGFIQTRLSTIDKYIDMYENGEADSDSYYLCKFGRFMAGYLQCDSYIYDGNKHSARITEQDLEAYRNPPEDEQYYLVVLDIHF
ncbi:MAG: hypothetical protein J6T96_05380 [Bacteroidales bacterium]|nr:hypothetical protein [Bacteroidales bacterium]